MIREGFVAIGGAEIGDLTHVSDPEEIGRILTRSMPDRTERAIRLYVGYWRRFLWDMVDGDVVVTPTQSSDLAVGRVNGAYRYHGADEEHSRHRRGVHWLSTGVRRTDADPDLLRTISGRHTVQEFKQPDAAHRLVRQARAEISGS